jgi:prepilin-type N-terminal cleavage/methylation domain-containing protein
MKLHRTPPRRSDGFTLLELMIVIGIILLLISMLIAGISYAFGRADEVKVRHEISSMSSALKQWQTDFSVNVPPPSRIALYQNYSSYTSNQLDTESLAFLFKVWPRVFGGPGGTVAVNWGPNNQGGNFVLEGEECLIFFLGGRQSTNAAGQWMCTGFATDPTNPMSTASGLGQTKGPYYVFDSNRLARAQSIGLQTAANFLVYVDPFGTNVPYAYFSSGKGKNTYNAYAGAPSTWTNPGFTSPPQPAYPSYDCPSLFWTDPKSGKRYEIQPYYQMVNNAPQYYNSDSFQIICAGKDGKFGAGGQWSSQSGPAGAGTFPNGGDDLSNFYDSRLGVVP